MSSRSTHMQDETRATLHQAAAWRLQGLLFERPREGWAKEVATLAREVRDEDLRAAAQTAQSADEGQYLAFLGPGAVSPREAAYRSFADPAAILSELVTFHRAFAFQPRAEDPLDHVAVEAAFVGYLSLKHAAALAEERGEAAALAAEAREAFIERHLHPMAGPLARRLEAVDAPEWLLLASRALVNRVGDAPDPRLPFPDDAELPLPDCPGACAT
jgi:hypothetical protein